MLPTCTGDRHLLFWDGHLPVFMVGWVSAFPLPLQKLVFSLYYIILSSSPCPSSLLPDKIYFYFKRERQKFKIKYFKGTISRCGTQGPQERVGWSEPCKSSPEPGGLRERAEMGEMVGRTSDHTGTWRKPYWQSHGLWWDPLARGLDSDRRKLTTTIKRDLSCHTLYTHINTFVDRFHILRWPIIYSRHLSILVLWLGLSPHLGDGGSWWNVKTGYVCRVIGKTLWKQLQGDGPFLVGEHGSLHRGGPLGCSGLLVHRNFKQREVNVITSHKTPSWCCEPAVWFRGKQSVDSASGNHLCNFP